MPHIEISDLHFAYADSRNNEEALRGVNLDIKSGEFVCVIGMSGCGKSTLLRMLAGLDMPTSGEVRINGELVTDPGADRMIVFQDYALFPWLTAEKNISFALERGKHMPRIEARRVASDYLAKVGMESAAGLYPCQLSGGMKQRVAIARALSMDTDILLLDEPFGALDAKTRASLQQLLLTLWENTGGEKKTVVFVTHDINEALILADRVVCMKPGRISTELAVDLPRPRKSMGNDACFAVYKKMLLRLIEGGETEVRE